MWSYLLRECSLLVYMAVTTSTINSLRFISDSVARLLRTR